MLMPSRVEQNEFPTLAVRLAASGVPARGVRRLIAELSDHMEMKIASLIADGHAEDRARSLARTQLGREDDILAAVLSDARAISCLRRRPIVMFVCTPIVVLFASVLAAGALGVLAFDMLCGWMSVSRYSEDAARLARGLYLPIAYAVTPSIAAAYTVLGCRRGCGLPWTLAAAIVIALIGAHLSLTYAMPVPETKSGTVGIHLSPIVHLPRLVFPLLAWSAAVLLVRRHRSATT